ncbi:hypothetical protein M2390_000513 [Mycetocola sp. BIGb0189]|nr:hypothetical protein [Mycetocola sp. BIGb0189]MCS4275352.1 hypothetical protein [Mycetocola sp. BIGb0189]
MKVILQVRPSEVTTIEVEADTYEAALEQAQAQVPEGFAVLSIRKEK